MMDGPQFPVGGFNAQLHRGDHFCWVWLAEARGGGRLNPRKASKEQMEHTVGAGDATQCKLDHDLGFRGGK